MSEEPKTQEELQLEASRYRFGGLRYSIRGPAGRCSSDQIIPQEDGNYAFPKSDDTKEEKQQNEGGLI